MKKEDELLEKINHAVRLGSWRLTEHAKQRMHERDVVLPEIEFILLNGWHNQHKDKWNDEWKSWRYAICGDIDGSKIRLAVSLKIQIIVVTVIDEDI